MRSQVIAVRVCKRREEGQISERFLRLWQLFVVSTPRQTKPRSVGRAGYIDAMKLQPVVRDLRLGSEVAEQDQHLTRYFVRNAAYYNVIDDEVDVILGPKGSGKSAISRTLVDPNLDRPRQIYDVDIVPAFNLHGSSIFRRLSAEIGGAEESTMRTAWTVYILALIGNHIVDNYWNGYVEDLSKRLDKLGLRYIENRPKSVWSTVVSTIRNIKPSKVETSLTVSTPGVSGSATAEFTPGTLLKDPVDWEALLDLELEALESVGKRCWVVFDRLDEAFPHDRDLERTALRALLHTHRDVCSYGSRLKTKLFLRTDLLDRITEGEGFVNATHLRTHRINWDRDSIQDFVVRRVLGSPEVAAVLDINSSCLEDASSRVDALHRVIASDLGGTNMDSTDWMIAYTTDASSLPNPRNVLTLLRESRTRQLEVCQRQNSDFIEGQPLLSKPAIRAGQRDLSRIRCQDTLFAEFAELRDWLEAMKGRPFTYTPEQFATTMGYEQPSELAPIIEDLKYAGVFRQAPNGKLTVPVLYRVGLNLQDRGDHPHPGRDTRRGGRR